MAPEMFNQVWFTYKRQKRNLELLAYSDIGALTVDERSIEFRGRSTALKITDIRSITYGKHGRDFINNWVMVEYFDGKALNTACFADGSQRGWGGVLGGTKRIFNAVMRMCD